MSYGTRSRRSNRLVVVFGALLLAMVGFPYVGGSSPAFAAVQEEFYVSPTGSDSNDGTSVASPFQTLGKARQAVGAINDNMTGDIVVYLLEGTYTLTSTFTLDDGDSGSNGFNVIYKDYEGDAGEAIISGGVDLDTLPANWQVHDATNNIYKLTGVDWAFRQLYVNGERAVRSREPDLTDEATGGHYTSTTDNRYPFNILTSQIDPWWNDATHSGVVEFVWNAHWNQWRGRIDDYSPVANTNVSTVTFKTPERDFALNHHPPITTFFYLENALELLDTEGEWFLDKATDTLYYKPRAGETISTAEMIAPKVEVLLNLEGTVEDVAGQTVVNDVHHVQFYGITFRHSNWTDPDQYGYRGSQGVHQGVIIDEISLPVDGSYTQSDILLQTVPGAVEVKHGRDIRFERNTIELGGAWGITEYGDRFINEGTTETPNWVPYGGSHDNTYVGNVFRNLAAGAIGIGNSLNLHRFGGPLMPVGTASGDVISNNLIEYMGRDYRDSDAVAAFRVQNVLIEHNEIRHVGYSGIHLGWNRVADAEQVRDNVIAFNRIHHVMELLDDGGGIYTIREIDNPDLGQEHDITIHRNFVYNLVDSPYNGDLGAPGPGPQSPFSGGIGLYLDAGASFQRFIHNVIDNTPTSIWAGNVGGAKEHDNVAQFNHYNTPEFINDNGTDPPPFSVWQGNEDLEGLNWSDVSKTFMNAAGIEEEYRDMGNVTTGFNVAQGKSASASSVSSATPASMAIDNNVRAGLWASDLVQANPYWQVDLGREYNIYQVDVVARQDTDHVNARRNFEIQASNDPSFSTYTVLGSQGNKAFQSKGTWSAYVDESDSYRYLRVQRTNSGGHFAFAEFRAYGTVAVPTVAMASWLRADAGVAKDASRVSGWTDQSPAGTGDAAQTTANEQPLWVDNQIVGRPMLRFDGVNDNLSIASLTGNMDDFTLFFVLKPDTTTDFNQRIGATGAWGEFNFHTTSSGAIYVGTSTSSRITPGSGPDQTDAGTLQDGKFLQLTYHLRDGAARLYKNGVQIAVKQPMADPADWTGFDLGATTSATLDGDLAEVLVYNGGLSMPHRQAVEEYLAIKYILP